MRIILSNRERLGDGLIMDLDIMVAFEPGAEGTIYDYVRFKEFVASLFQELVDVIDRAALRPHPRAPLARDAVYAF
jgi:predicted nucleotidyltransferase